MKQFRQSPARPKKSSLVIGRQAVIRALQEGTYLDRIYLDQQATGEDIRTIKQLASAMAVPVNYVPAARLNNFNITGHEGCVAQRARVQYQQLQEVISWVTDQGEVPLFLILDGITDIRNIGGIARTALCTGVQAIIIPDKGVGALNEDAILTSAGALEKIAVCRVSSLLKAIDELHLNGILVYASEMTAGKTIAEADFRLPCAVIMGSEDKGIYPALMKSCDEKLSIPMKADFESLNVSVAAGMILYEAMKQRMQ